jgi:hypothetical protein
VKAKVCPAATVPALGLTVIEVSAAGVTVSEAVPVIVPEVAVIVTGPPTATPVAKPALLIVAVAVAEELQFTLPVMFCVLLSVKVPVAVYCWVLPFAIELLAGATAIETSPGPLTVSEAVPVIVPEVAVMVTGPPAETPVARPAVDMEATPLAEELQFTLPVMFWVLLSVKVPVAVYCCVVPFAIVLLAGVTAMDTRVGLVTVSEAVPLIEPEVAVMVTGPPTATPEAKPVPEAMFPIAEFEEVHVTLVVMI